MTKHAEVIKFPDQPKAEHGSIAKSHGGFVALFRSVNKKDWWRDPLKRTVFTEIMTRAAHTAKTDTVNGVTCELVAGEFLSSVNSLAEDTGILDLLGNKKTAESRISSILNYFVKDGFISKICVGSGRKKVTKITILNWSKFQVQNQVQNQSQRTAPQAALNGDSQAQNQAQNQVPLNNIKTIKDLKDPSSENSSQTKNEAMKFVRENSVIQSANGKKWGEEIDLSIAQKIFDGVNELLGGEERQPNFADWANTIRLMRERDLRKPEHILALFDFANCDNFWKSNVLSPTSLRKHWKKLAIQRKDEKNQPAKSIKPDLNLDDRSWAEHLDEVL